MKLLISSSSETRALACEYSRSLVEIDPSIQLINFAHSELFRNLTQRNLLSRCFNRAFPIWYSRRLDQELLRLVKVHNPNVVWIFKGMEFSPNVWHSIKKQGCLLVNYNADHPFDHFSKGSGNINVTQSVPLFDLYITYSREIAQEIQSRVGTPKTKVIPFGFSLPLSKFQQIGSDDEVLRACFVGNADGARIAFLRDFALGGVPLDIWGTGWENFPQSTGVDVRLHPLVFDDDYWRTLRRYRVQLNLFRPHNRNSHNMRSFEVPACGGVMLAPETDEHLEFFKSGEEAYFYKDLPDAIIKARQILAADKREIDRVRQAARDRSMNSGYQYVDRAKSALHEIRSLLDSRGK